MMIKTKITIFVFKDRKKGNIKLTMLFKKLNIINHCFVAADGLNCIEASAINTYTNTTAIEENTVNLKQVILQPQH